MVEVPAEPPRPPWALPTPPYQSERTRIHIIFAYWSILLLGVPLWWAATTIERLALPRGRLEQFAHIRDDLRPSVSLSIRSDHPPPLDSTTLAARLEAQLRNAGVNDSKMNLTVFPALSREGTPLEYSIDLLPQRKDGPRDYASYELDGRILKVTPNVGASSAVLLDEMARILRDLLLPPSDPAYELRVAQYAPRYRLSFSLLNEDSSIGGAAMGWDIEHAILSHIQPTLESLNSLHNFTIESQVQFHAPLAFSPQPIPNDTGAYGLGEDELKVFVNSAEWTLASSTTNDPVLHFLLFVPARDRRPLWILDAEGERMGESSAFLIPQWGGVVVLNLPQAASSTHLSLDDLHGPFRYFDHQLQSLLGVAKLPERVTSLSRGVSQWQTDLLLRHRTMENTRRSLDTMQSIIKLVDRMQGMPVGESVRTEFEVALDALAQVEGSVGDEKTFMASARAFVHSSSAFFNPTMVAMLYFPMEHKYAVYTPLFAPVAVPVVVALLREVKERLSKPRRRIKVEW